MENYLNFQELMGAAYLGGPDIFKLIPTNIGIRQENAFRIMN
jgi:hypothetical protein